MDALRTGRSGLAGARTADIKAAINQVSEFLQLSLSISNDTAADQPPTPVTSFAPPVGLLDTSAMTVPFDMLDHYRKRGASEVMPVAEVPMEKARKLRHEPILKQEFEPPVIPPPHPASVSFMDIQPGFPPAVYPEPAIHQELNGLPTKTSRPPSPRSFNSGFPTGMVASAQAIPSLVNDGFCISSTMGPTFLGDCGSIRSEPVLSTRHRQSFSAGARSQSFSDMQSLITPSVPIVDSSAMLPAAGSGGFVPHLSKKGRSSRSGSLSVVYNDRQLQPDRQLALPASAFDHPLPIANTVHANGPTTASAAVISQRSADSSRYSQEPDDEDDEEEDGSVYCDEGSVSKLVPFRSHFILICVLGFGQCRPRA